MSDPTKPWEVREDPDALLQLMRDYAEEIFEPGSTELSEHGLDSNELSHGLTYMFSCLDELMRAGNAPKEWKHEANGRGA
jgi:hypothetical protein